MGSRVLRLGLLVAGALAACLAVLWACVVLGLWLALQGVA